MTADHLTLKRIAHWTDIECDFEQIDLFELRQLARDFTPHEGSILYAALFNLLESMMGGREPSDDAMLDAFEALAEARGAA